MDGRYPALLIQADAQKNHTEQLLPIAPEFAEFLLAVPATERNGLVFGIYGQGRKPLSTKRASRYISAIGKAAGVITNKSEKRYAGAHDLRRSFCTRWAKKVMPADLKVLARHASISTTMQYYVCSSAEELGDRLRLALGTNPSTNEENSVTPTSVDIDAKRSKIRT